MRAPEPLPLVLAHRGDHTRSRENTTAAFGAAHLAGADGVELDVRRSADGILLVHHDATADGVGVLGHATFGQVRDVLPWLPTLDEALDACARMHLVNVEIKNIPTDPDFDESEGIVDAVVDLAARRRSDPGPRMVISSFMVPSLERVKGLDATIETAWLTFPDLEPRAALRAAAERGIGGVHPARQALERSDVPGVVDHARDLGLALRPWTVNDAGDLRRFLAAGVDAVITDRPADAVALRNEEPQ
ncbi:MAG: glycerophosphodiester phosphodiesterase [Acidimicrobiia bacterium]